MGGLRPELPKLISALELAQGSKDLLLATMLGEGSAIAPNHGLELLWLLQNLRSDRCLSLIPLQKAEWLKNFLSLLRQSNHEWVRTVCCLLYEGSLPPESAIGPFPEGLIRDLLKWVNEEKAEKVREMLWAVLLRKEIGLACFAKTSDLAPGLYEKDPITRNNILRFLSNHFTPEQVLDSLFQYSMASGKRVPGVVFKRYVGLLKDLVDLPQKKSILERILSSAQLDDTEIDQIFSAYINTLSRFDLIRLLSLSDGRQPGIADLKPKRRQTAFAFHQRRTVLHSHEGFRKRISAIRDRPKPLLRFDVP